VAGQPDPAAAPERGLIAVADVFISHVEEDAADALEIADALEAAGYSTWCYERDSIPGPSYLVQTGDAVEQSHAVVVLISRHALGSHQVTLEVVRGHEAEKPFIPVLIGITHVEFANRQPEWREAIGAATSVAVPREGVGAVTGRITEGLHALGVEPTGAGEHRTAVTAGVRRRSPGNRLRGLGSGWRIGLVAAATGVIVLGAVLGATLLTRGERDASPAGPAATGTPTAAPTTTPTGPSGASGSTPLQTNVGDVRVAAADLLEEFCPPSDFPGPCTKPTSGRFLVLTMKGWAGGLLTIDLTQESNQSYVTHGEDRYDPSMVADEYQGVVRVVFDAVPASLAGKDVTLVWPNGQQIAVHVAG
jgi:hypothetical protein